MQKWIAITLLSLGFVACPVWAAVPNSQQTINSSVASYMDNSLYKSLNVQISQPMPVAPRVIELSAEADGPALLAHHALVIDQRDGKVLFEKNANVTQPIASITKLMTAIVVLESGQSLAEVITISQKDVDTIKGTRSRLKSGVRFSRGELLQLMLMASENRAAFALARNYPGGTEQFVATMNRRALRMGMMNTHFADTAGLHSSNVATAHDLARLVQAAYGYELIREFSITPVLAVEGRRARRVTLFKNTNRLTRDGDWQIGLSKTGFINEAGQCLVMQATIAGKPVIIVLLDSHGHNGRIDDARQVRDWLLSKPRSYAANL